MNMNGPVQHEEITSVTTFLKLIYDIDSLPSLLLTVVASDAELTKE